jgi:hypothetical protein
MSKPRTSAIRTRSSPISSKRTRLSGSIGKMGELTKEGRGLNVPARRPARPPSVSCGLSFTCRDIPVGSTWSRARSSEGGPSCRLQLYSSSWWSALLRDARWPSRKGNRLRPRRICCSSSDWLTGEGGGDRLAPYLATKVAELRSCGRDAPSAQVSPQTCSSRVLGQKQGGRLSSECDTT